MLEGTIVEESLVDSRILNDFEVVSVKLTGNPDPVGRWHLWNVRATEEQIAALERQLKGGTWYAHFWDSNQVTAVFSGRSFTFPHADRAAWGPVLAYGRSLGIPEEQLDFPAGFSQ